MSIDYTSRLAALRAELAALGYDGFLVPMSDAYQSEYVPASEQRIAFLSGFTGSAGYIAVLTHKAAFFTDGRYTLQAQQQVPVPLFSLHDSTVESPAEWLAKNVGESAKIAYDPWLHTEDGVARLKKSLDKVKATLIPVDNNPVDGIWHDRPAPPSAPIHPHERAYAGQSSADKRAHLADELKKKNLSAAIITDPASIAWLLNVRGADVPNTPLPLSFAILHDDARVNWFVDPQKISQGLEQHLGPQIDIESPDQFPPKLDRLGQHDAKPVRIDPAESASWIVARLRAANVNLDLGEDPCVLPKACKNAVEMDGMRAAHRRDGAALVKFFAWLSHNIASDAITELSAEEKLGAYRAANDLYRGPSFDTIAGMGPHGAIVHYRATPETSIKLELGHLFLLDSGGQYCDGTTDVTRTVALGAPTPEMRDRFTRVLKGHIALAAIRFPEGTTGAELDVLARQYLWAVGLDYNHGTGHGVGAYLGVHEGPQGISKRNRVALKPGMVLSNEPGYYKAGHYGIRIENLQAVIEVADISAERKMLGFEPLTLVPIDRHLIDAALLTADETAWINAYHARVHDALSPMLDADAARWLTEATRAL